MRGNKTLTDAEIAVVELLGHAVSAFMNLSDHDAMDQQDFCDGVHQLQRQVMARSAIRSYPMLFTSMAPLRRSVGRG